MGTDVIELPEYNGGSCINPRCAGSTKQRILSVEEVERVYPVKDKFDWWPLPPQATHVCTVCGFTYNRVGENFQSEQQPAPKPQREFPIDEWDWSHEDQFDIDIRDAVIDFAQAAPERLLPDEVAQAAGRYIVGVSPEQALRILEHDDRYEQAAVTADQFM